MIITSEQVSNGHPDKICDQISDAVLTVCLEQDKNSKVAVETLIKDNHIVVAGEMKTTALFDLNTVVRNVVKPLGMKNIIVTNLIGLQSDDISQGVDTGGAGDQGMMYGYATDETEEYLPLPYVLATRVLENLMELQHPLLGKDAKAQVSYDYDNKRITTFLVSIQHSDEITIENLRAIVKESMMKVAKRYRQNLDFNILVNPTGRFVLGGSYADAGVTGRKIIADTYGGFAHHGGGAFSGKDPSKVDRSAAYAARYVAKNIVAAGLADRCEIQLSYAIGVAEPTSIMVETFGTGKVSNEVLVKLVREFFDLRPYGLIKMLNLIQPIYRQTAAYGHFGREQFPWEKVDRAEELRAAAGLK